MIVVSCYTPEYAKLARRLEGSAIQHNLKCDIRPVTDQGSWIANTWTKPQILLDALENHPGEPVCWIDADAVVVQKPILLGEYERHKVQLAWAYEWRHYYLDRIYNPATYQACPRNGSDDPGLSRGGTIYLANNRKSRLFLKAWVDERRGCLSVDVSSQPSQSWAASRVAGLTPTALPLSYCSIFDSDAKRDPDPVIVHYQASREFRK